MTKLRTFSIADSWARALATQGVVELGSFRTRQLQSAGVHPSSWMGPPTSLPAARSGRWGRDALGFITSVSLSPALIGCWRQAPLGAPTLHRAPTRVELDAVATARDPLAAAAPYLPAARPDLSAAGVSTLYLTGVPLDGARSAVIVGEAASAFSYRLMTLEIAAEFLSGRLFAATPAARSPARPDAGAFAAWKQISPRPGLRGGMRESEIALLREADEDQAWRFDPLAGEHRCELGLGPLSVSQWILATLRRPFAENAARR